MPATTARRAQGNDKMNTYLIDPRKNNDNSGERFTVDAADITAAAKSAAQQILGEKFEGLVYRETGEPNGSGMFQAYHHLHGTNRTETSVGYPFHVMEL
ncbi:hypothetical protein F8135_30085 [Pseudomonas aeruginosa]|nr:hypothetical protein F8135_30085 [Pseudomonas aeruginosa]KSO16604.1 hypothetical protein APA92_17475 [Pseudomonas aeruginosa]KSS52694.1 hypothetical protein APB59_14620 [Pseudomonas aeruginosa]MBS2058465.1 hypothetical protein [Pseudomonas aeruginosa]OTH02893.1 hypothetical protein CAY85_29445 [Pseudomonas aeruginosa]